MNAQRFNVYVSVNAIKPGVRARTKDAIGAVRHLFLEADDDGPAGPDEARGLRRPAIAVLCPRIVAESSSSCSGAWPASQPKTIERLQKHLATRSRTDPAATSCSQTTRLPGYRNHKRDSVAPRDNRVPDATEVRYAPQRFRHRPPVRPDPRRRHAEPTGSRSMSSNVRAAISRASSRQSPGSTATCTRSGSVVESCEASRSTTTRPSRCSRDWNARCSPPWTEGDLRPKVAGARRYGREPIGVILPR